MNHAAKIIPLLATLAFAWNPPIGVCPPEALKKLDHFATLQEGGIIKDSKPFSQPLDNGKCFLYGYDLYVEGSSLGIENKKTGDKLEYRGKENGAYNFGCKSMNTPEKENCVFIGIEKGSAVSLISQLSNGDTIQFFTAFKPDKITFAKAIYVKSGRDNLINSELHVFEDKNKSRLDATWESSLSGEYWKVEGGINRSDILSVIKASEKFGTTNIKKADSLISTLDKIYLAKLKTYPK